MLWFCKKNDSWKSHCVFKKVNWKHLFFLRKASPCYSNSIRIRSNPIVRTACPWLTRRKVGCKLILVDRETGAWSCQGYVMGIPLETDAIHNASRGLCVLFFGECPPLHTTLMGQVEMNRNRRRRGDELCIKLQFFGLFSCENQVKWVILQINS